MNSINILFLASEITKGMKSIGPRCLLKLNNSEVVLDYQISMAKTSYKNSNIFVLTGFEDDKVNKHINCKYRTVKTIHNESYTFQNETGAVLKAIESLGKIDNLLVVNSGVLLKEYPKIKSLNRSTIFYLNKPKSNFTIGTFDKESHYLFYDLPNIWSECVFFDALTIARLRLMNKNSTSQYYLFETINKLIDDNIFFDSKIIHKNRIFKINSHKDITQAKRFSRIK